MKRKGIFIAIAVVFILLAIYGIWHFSPLRTLTQSKPDPTRTRPLIVAKKIRPVPDKPQKSDDLNPPLVVAKPIEAEKTAKPAKPQAEIKPPAADMEKSTPSTTEAASPAKIAQTKPAEAKKPVKPQPAAKPAETAQAQPAKQAQTTPRPVVKKAAAVQPESRYPYSIMLSSCRLPQSARNVVSDYQKAGLAPYVVKVKFESGDEWLRVLAGQYPTLQEARKAQKEHRLTGTIVKKTPYANLIGTYASRAELQADLQKTKKLGFSPYFFKAQGGKLKLMVGAFVTREGAENHQAELKAKGIQSTVVKR
jgi:cell division septation protein DedD